jgi:hypothetical protein
MQSSTTTTTFTHRRRTDALGHYHNRPHGPAPTRVNARSNMFQLVSNPDEVHSGSDQTLTHADDAARFLLPSPRRTRTFTSTRSSTPYGCLVHTYSRLPRTGQSCVRRRPARSLTLGIAQARRRPRGAMSMVLVPPCPSPPPRRRFPVLRSPGLRRGWTSPGRTSQSPNKTMPNLRRWRQRRR